MSRKNRTAPVPSGPGPWPARSVLLGTAGALILFSTALSEGFGLPKLAALASGTTAAWAGLAKSHADGALLRRATPLDAPLAVCALVFLASLAASPDRFIGIVGTYSLYSDGLFAFLLCTGVFLAAAWSDLPERPEAGLDLLAACAGLAGAYGVLQAMGLDPFAWFRAMTPGRAGSTLGDPVPFGAVLSAALPAAAAAARGATPGRRLLGRAAVILVLAGLAASGSRGPLLAGAAGVGVWASLAFAHRPAARRGVAVGALAALVLGGFLVMRRRHTSESDSARLALWRCIPAIVRENPLLGAGPARFHAAMRRHRSPDFVRIRGPRITQVDAHNDLLQAAAVTGLLGLAAFLWLQWGAFTLLRGALASERLRAAACAASGMMAALFVQAKVNPLPLGAWAMAALVLGSLAAGERRRASWGVPVLAAAAFAAVLFFSLRLCAADLSFADARRAARQGRGREAALAFEGAIAANPRENFYRREYARLLYDAAQKSAGPEKGALLERAVLQGELAAALRPAEADGWAMRGAYLIAWRLAGGPDRLREAREYLETARRMDPYAPAVNDNLALLKTMSGGNE